MTTQVRFGDSLQYLSRKVVKVVLLLLSGLVCFWTQSAFVVQRNCLIFQISSTESTPSISPEKSESNTNGQRKRWPGRSDRMLEESTNKACSECFRHSFNCGYFATTALFSIPFRGPASAIYWMKERQLFAQVGRIAKLTARVADNLCQF